MMYAQHPLLNHRALWRCPSSRAARRVPKPRHEQDRPEGGPSRARLGMPRLRRWPPVDRRPMGASTWRRPQPTSATARDHAPITARLQPLRLRGRPTFAGHPSDRSNRPGSRSPRFSKQKTTTPIAAAGSRRPRCSGARRWPPERHGRRGRILRCRPRGPRWDHLNRSIRKRSSWLIRAESMPAAMDHRCPAPVRAGPALFAPAGSSAQPRAGPACSRCRPIRAHRCSRRRPRAHAALSLREHRAVARPRCANASRRRRAPRASSGSIRSGSTIR